MSALRQKFDTRNSLMGIQALARRDNHCNQIGMHIYHVGEIIDIRCHDNNLHVKILGKVNGHIVGKIVSFVYSENQQYENMHIGQLICFDEKNIFGYYE